MIWMTVVVAVEKRVMGDVKYYKKSSFGVITDIKRIIIIMMINKWCSEKGGVV